MFDLLHHLSTRQTATRFAQWRAPARICSRTACAPPTWRAGLCSISMISWRRNTPPGTGLDSARHFTQYVRGIVAAAATSNAVFGFRFESWDVERFVTRLRESGNLARPMRARPSSCARRFRACAASSSPVRTNWGRRSPKRARCRPICGWLRGKRTLPERQKFDPVLIDHCLFSARRAEETWSDFFQRNEIEPLSITYEDLCSDYPATMGRVLDFLRIRLPHRCTIGPPITVRQADAITQEWAKRYRALRPEETLSGAYPGRLRLTEIEPPATGPAPTPVPIQPIPALEMTADSTSHCTG